MVYLCTPKGGQKAPYIVKVIRSDFGGQAEQSCLQHCAHPNVVRQVSSTTSADGNWRIIAMEYCDGGDLFQEILRRRESQHHFSESEVCAIIAQLVLALHHIHSKQVLHRDVKAANVLLATPPPSVPGTPFMLKVGDFGLAKMDDRTLSEEADRTFCGTVPNIAPEMLQQRVDTRRSTYGKAADVWSLGVTMYEVMCLRPPFTSDPYATVANDMTLHNIINRNCPPIPEALYSQQLRDLVERSMLCVDPSRRVSLHQIAVSPAIFPYVKQFAQNYSDPSGTLIQQFEVISVDPDRAAAFGTFHRMTSKGTTVPYEIDVGETKLFLTHKGSGDPKRVHLAKIMRCEAEDELGENDEECDSEAGSEEAIDGPPRAGYPFGVAIFYFTGAEVSGQEKTIMLFSDDVGQRDALLAHLRDALARQRSN